jgi:hypothetical protein
MERFSLALRIGTWVAAIVIVVGAYVGWKIYHQMHTPLSVIVIERGR